MISFLNSLVEIGGLQAATLIVFTCVAIRELYNFNIWIKGILNNYHIMEDEKESQAEMVKKLDEEMLFARSEHKEFKNQINKFKEIENKVDDIEIMMDKYSDNMDKLCEKIEELKLCLNNAEMNRNSYTLASCRSILYDLHKEGMSQGYTDQAAYETFEALKNIYIQLGGNSIIRHRIIPEYEQLPIRGLDNLEEGDKDD